MESLQFEKEKFLKKNAEYLVFMSSLIGGFVYPLYGPAVPDEEKDRFKKHLRQKLRVTAEGYKQKHDPEEHAGNIEVLQKELNSKWQKVLYPHRLPKKQVGITFGRVQKLLNLYLKYYWILGRTEKPPHCPIDSIILEAIHKPSPTWQNPAFTKEIYLDRIEKCREKASECDMSIAEWELRMFNDR